MFHLLFATSFSLHFIFLTPNFCLSFFFPFLFPLNVRIQSNALSFSFYGCWIVSGCCAFILHFNSWRSFSNICVVFLVFVWFPCSTCVPVLFIFIHFPFVFSSFATVMFVFVFHVPLIFIFRVVYLPPLYLVHSFHTKYFALFWFQHHSHSCCISCWLL